MVLPDERSAAQMLASLLYRSKTDGTFVRAQETLCRPEFKSKGDDLVDLPTSSRTSVVSTDVHDSLSSSSNSLASGSQDKKPCSCLKGYISSGRLRPVQCPASRTSSISDHNRMILIDPKTQEPYVYVLVPARILQPRPSFVPVAQELTALNTAEKNRQCPIVVDEHSPEAKRCTKCSKRIKPDEKKMEISPILPLSQNEPPLPFNFQPLHNLSSLMQKVGSTENSDETCLKMREIHLSSKADSGVIADKSILKWTDDLFAQKDVSIKEQHELSKSLDCAHRDSENIVEQTTLIELPAESPDLALLSEKRSLSAILLDTLNSSRCCTDLLHLPHNSLAENAKRQTDVNSIDLELTPRKRSCDSNSGSGKKIIKKSDCFYCLTAGLPESCGYFANKCPNRPCSFCNGRHRYKRCKKSQKSDVQTNIIAA